MAALAWKQGGHCTLVETLIGNRQADAMSIAILGQNSSHPRNQAAYFAQVDTSGLASNIAPCEIDTN
jgi:hypothetical protein